MTDFSFPKKPNYNFTKEQMLERKRVLRNKVEHIKFKDLKNTNKNGTLCKISGRQYCSFCIKS